MLKNPWVALTKPRLTALSALSAIIGYILGWDYGHDLLDAQFFWTCLGVALVGGGANALNMLMEREYDALMDRTKNRPLPAKTLSFQQVLAYGVTFAVC
jgi:protoheme IX farnesyltransferase